VEKRLEEKESPKRERKKTLKNMSSIKRMQEKGTMKEEKI